MIWHFLITMSSIRGPTWCRYSTEKCLPDSHLPFVYVAILETRRDKSIVQNFQNIVLYSHTNFQEKLSYALTARPQNRSENPKLKLDPQANFPGWLPPDLHTDTGWATHWIICSDSSIFNMVKLQLLRL